VFADPPPPPPPPPPCKRMSYQPLAGTVHDFEVVNTVSEFPIAAPAGFGGNEADAMNAAPRTSNGARSVEAIVLAGRKIRGCPIRAFRETSLSATFMTCSSRPIFTQIILTR
jgi:hypothetical protein